VPRKHIIGQPPRRLRDDLDRSSLASDPVNNGRAVHAPAYHEMRRNALISQGDGRTRPAYDMRRLHHAEQSVRPLLLLRITILSASVALAGCLLSARAGPASEADAAEFQRIITAQIEAFRADDAARAFDFASPGIQAKFAGPAQFMAMVQSGYAAVFRPRTFSFGSVTEEMGRPTQRVNVVGPDGESWLALYHMEQQPDGTWRIAGCVLIKAPASEA
jgi:Domain of unknown function (DUF4864)